jgi:serine/threonine-protein kinase
VERTPDLTGRTLGAYTLDERLGAGATGVVYRATGPSGLVALKVLTGDLGPVRRRFERETRVLGALDHPNVVRVIDFGIDGDATFIAMELLDGITLDALLGDTAIEPARAIDVMIEALDGLAYAHARGLVHRDLKPANVMLCRGGRDDDRSRDRVKVLDFGLARFLSSLDDGLVTSRGRIVGTPAYMAPEQITGGALDVRTDVYAAGVLLFELLADRRPFPYEKRAEILRAHLTEPPPSLSAVRPELHADPALEQIVARALVKPPSGRFFDAGAMRDALRALPHPPTSLASAPTSDRPPRTSAHTAVAGAPTEVDPSSGDDRSDRG